MNGPNLCQHNDPDVTRPRETTESNVRYRIESTRIRVMQLSFLANDCINTKSEFLEKICVNRVDDSCFDGSNDTLTNDVIVV